MTNGDEPASPCQSDVHGQQFRGLSIRGYYAGLAMQGIIASMDAGSADPATFKQVAIESVGYSDYLIAELNKQTT